MVLLPQANGQSSTVSSIPSLSPSKAETIVVLKMVVITKSEAMNRDVLTPPIKMRLNSHRLMFVFC